MCRLLVLSLDSFSGSAREIWQILKAAWEETGLEGTVDPKTVVADILPPYHPDCAVDPADIMILLRPNYTPERWRKQYLLRRCFMRQLEAWMEEHRVTLSDSPDFDVDIDFIMGPGAYLDHEGKVASHWPDSLGAPYEPGSDDEFPAKEVVEF
jgi:hypothetical protein